MLQRDLFGTTSDGETIRLFKGNSYPILTITRMTPGSMKPAKITNIRYSKN